MKYKTTPIFYKLFFIQLVFAFFISNNTYSQIINAPTVVGNNSVCAISLVQTNNKFNFTTSGIIFDPTNVFSLEISDTSGQFTNSPNIVATNNVSPINYVVPTNFVGGSGFRFRIRSSNPAYVGVATDASSTFEIYYLIFNSGFTINNNQLTATICGGAGITLSVDNPLSPPTSINGLKYNWYKNGAKVANKVGPSYLVLAGGVYFAQVDYGGCSIIGSSSNQSIAVSQSVTVNFGTSGANYLITSSSGNVVSATSSTVLSTPSIPGDIYQWFQNGSIITSETNSSLSTNQSGTYYLQVSNGVCTSTTNSIELKELPVSNAKLIPNMVSQNNDGQNDLWELEQKYITGSNTEVTIFDSKGKIVLQTKEYLNDWPDSILDFDSVNPVYYYIITPEVGEIKKGSITIVK